MGILPRAGLRIRARGRDRAGRRAAGIPLGLFELKNAGAENAGLDEAYQQLQTYKLPDNIPTLFHYSGVLVTSDGISARIGSVTAGKERFARWRTIEGEGEARTSDLELEVLVKGVFEKRRFLELLRSFVVFEHEGGGNVAKKIAGYHQFHAVEKAVQATVRATSPKGDRKAGVIWHTQGSGKSLTMAFYAGKVNRPDISILSDDFLAEVRDLPQKHVAAELLRKLLENEIKGHTKTNLVKSVAFSEMLDESLKRYRNRAVSTLEVIEELIKLAKNVRQDRERGASIGLTPAEVAFYDALAANESARDLLGEPVLMKMAQELARIIRQNATIDWNLRETVRAKLRSLVRRLLRKYKYPPDAQDKATETVLKQAEILADEWAA